MTHYVSVTHKGDLESDTVTVVLTVDGVMSSVCVVPECDSCAQTLLTGLEKLDEELGRIKSQLDNASASASSQDRLRKLEKAISDTKVPVLCQCTIILPSSTAEHKQGWRTLQRTDDHKLSVESEHVFTDASG